MCVKQQTIPGDVLPGCGELGGAGQPMLRRGGERGEKQHYVGTISVKWLWPFFTAETVRNIGFKIPTLGAGPMTW